MSITTIILIIAAVLIVIIIGIYNGLVRARVRMREALSDIDVQSKRRFDLVPNLVETVKGYMTQERTILENVTKARTAVMQSSGTPLEKADMENQFTGALKTLFAVSEQYPNLKSNMNFLELQRELEDTENKMMAARRFYNSTVQDLNTKIQTFPTSIIAGMFGFREEKFFEITASAEREPVKVKF